MKALSCLAKPSLDFSPFATAAEVPRWAASFYFEHIAWIVGLSLVPATQRVVSQLWGDHLPTLAAVSLEALTLLVRILLLVLILRAAVLCDPGSSTGGTLVGSERCDLPVNSGEVWWCNSACS